jgi:hypothetical protein
MPVLAMPAPFLKKSKPDLIPCLILPGLAIFCAVVLVCPVPVVLANLLLI